MAASTGRYGNSRTSRFPSLAREARVTMGCGDQAARPWNSGIPPARTIQGWVEVTGGRPARAQQDRAESQARAEADSHPSGPRMWPG